MKKRSELALSDCLLEVSIKLFCYGKNKFIYLFSVGIEVNVVAEGEALTSIYLINEFCSTFMNCDSVPVICRLLRCLYFSADLHVQAQNFLSSFFTALRSPVGDSNLVRELRSILLKNSCSSLVTAQDEISGGSISIL